MSDANENATFDCFPVDLGENEDDMLRETEEVLREVLDANRICSEMREIPTQLDEILNHLYECTGNGNDFNPHLNLPVDANDTHSFTLPTVTSDINMHSSTGLMQCPSLETCNTSDSAFFTTAQSTAQNSSLYVTAASETMASNDPNPSSSSCVLEPPDNYDSFLDFLVDPQSYQATTNNPEPTNSTLVYMNVNVPNKSQQENLNETFNLNNDRYTIPDVVNTGELQNTDDSFLVEYLSSIGETSQSYALATSAEETDQVCEAIQNDGITTTNQIVCPVKHIYSLPQDLDMVAASGEQGTYQATEVIHNNGIPAPANIVFNQHFYHLPQGSSPANDALFTSLVTPIDPSQPTTSPLNNQRPIISCRPLQVRLPTKRNNLEWAVINANKNDSINPIEDLRQDNELMQIQQSIPDIPFLNECQTPGRKTRKQALNPLEDDDMSVMNDKGEFSLVVARADEFVTLRKRLKKEAISSSCECGDSSVSSAGLGSMTTLFERTNVSTISISSDSDSDHEQPNSGVLKCFQCQKMFKSAGSFTVHRKRCDASYSVMDNSRACRFDVSYPKSETDQDCIAVDLSESNDIIFLNETIELVESDSLESLPEIKTESQKPSDNSIVSSNRGSSLLQASTNSMEIEPESTTESTKRNDNTKSSPPETNNSQEVIRKNRPLTRSLNKNMLACEICGENFTKKSCLIAHKRVHEKNFKCEYCFKEFKLKSAYDTHIRKNCEKVPLSRVKRLQLTEIK